MKKVWIIIIILAIVALSFLLSLNWVTTTQTEEDRIAMNFLGNILNDEYKPSSINMTNRLTQENMADGSKNQYGSIWYNNDEKLYVVIHYNDLEMTEISDIYFVAFPNDISNELNEGIASSYFNRYFRIMNSGDITCDSKSGISYCEAFWEGNDKNKMGMAVINSPDYKLVVFCEYPIGSVNYELSTCMQSL